MTVRLSSESAKSEPTHDQIAQRAYEIFLAHGATDGRMSKTGCVLKASCVRRSPGTWLPRRKRGQNTRTAVEFFDLLAQVMVETPIEAASIDGLTNSTTRKRSEQSTR